MNPGTVTKPNKKTKKHQKKLTMTSFQQSAT